MSTGVPIEQGTIALNVSQVRLFLQRWMEDFSAPPTAKDLIAMAVVLEGEASNLRLQALETAQQEISISNRR